MRKLLVVVDVQKDFVEGGALPYGWPKESNTKKVLDFVGEFSKQSNDNFIVATKDTHVEDYMETLEGKNLPVKHCIKNTPGWEFVDEIKEKCVGIEYHLDDVFLKRTFGTFAIKDWIDKLEKDTCEKFGEIILIGYDLAICVLANAVILRAAFPDKKITVLKDLCGCVNEETFNSAIKVLECQQIVVE